MDYQESIKRFASLINEESQFSEAVVRSQISPAARKEVEKSREEYKKVQSEKLALLAKVLDKDFHMKTPEEKKKITDSLGFGQSEKATESNGGAKITTHSMVNPDVLYSLAKNRKSEFVRESGLPHGMTFVYDRKKDKFYKDYNPASIHDSLCGKHNIYRCLRDNPDLYHGRILRVPKPIKDEFWEATVGKGIHLSLWRSPTQKDLDAMIERMGAFKPTNIHLPNPLAIDPDQPEHSTAELEKMEKDFLDFLKAGQQKNKESQQ